MGLFDDLKKKKYPNNRRPDRGMKCVYAGPEQMRRLRNRAEDEEPEIVEVYAGPGMMDEIGYEEEPEVTEDEVTEAEGTEPEEAEVEVTEAEKAETEKTEGEETARSPFP